MKTTARDFAIFKKEFLHWQKALGLTEWRICFKVGAFDTDYARIRADGPGRIATVEMTSIIDRNDDHWDPRVSARHEALELLLMGLNHVAERRGSVTFDQILEADHAIIRRLEYLFDSIENLHI